jgi:hypothetical protein
VKTVFGLLIIAVAVYPLACLMGLGIKLYALRRLRQEY